MATKTFEELKQLAIQIRDEKTNKQNTATRIGTQMLEHLDKLEQDYYDKTATNEELQARDEKLTELGLQSVYIGMHTQEAEINISAKTEESDCIFTINIPGYVYSEKESFGFGKTLTVSIKSDGLNKFYINKDTKEILVKDYGQVLWEDGYWLFLGFAYINVNQGTMSNHMFFGRYKYNGETYYNSSKEVYDVGIPCPHMIFGMWSTIPNFTLENSILSCPDLGLVMCTNGNAFYRSLPAVNLTIDTSTFGDSTIVIYNINTKNYSQIKYTGNINSFKEGDYIVGFLRLGKEFYANGIYLFNKKEKQYAGISDTESLNQFSYKNGIIGIDTEKKYSCLILKYLPFSVESSG